LVPFLEELQQQSNPMKLHLISAVNKFYAVQEVIDVKPQQVLPYHYHSDLYFHHPFALRLQAFRK
jgi:quercetin dioxygenase-like cupin family protein